MKRHILVFFAIFATVAANLNILQEWNDYKRRFGKSYNFIEDITRKLNYLANSNRIRMHNLRFNRGCETYSLGINQFTDMNFSEYARIFNEGGGLLPGGNALPPTGQCNNQNDNTIPWDNYDWRNFGAVSPVRDQGITCNSGWAFALLAALESRNFLTFASLPPPLSPQNLIDCIPPATCTSKTPDLGYNYIIQNQNVNTETAYPYTGRSGTCRYNPNNIGATMAAYETLTGTETEIQNTMRTYGPVVYQIDPLSFTFMHYNSGVYRPPLNGRPSNSRHYVAIIGQGNDPQGGNYWILKNSFGTTWGENGYMRFGSSATNRVKEVTYPIV